MGGEFMEATSSMDRLTLYLNKNEKQALKRLAQREGRSMAMQVRQMLLTQLQKAGELK